MRKERRIEVRRTASGDPLVFEVTVREERSETRHRVTLAKAEYERLTRGRHPPERVAEAAFCFLLDREPKEAILTRFDLIEISRYFPEFERELPGYIAATPADWRN